MLLNSQSSIVFWEKSIFPQLYSKLTSYIFKVFIVACPTVLEDTLFIFPVVLIESVLPFCKIKLCGEIIVSPPHSYSQYVSTFIGTNFKVLNILFEIISYCISSEESYALLYCLLALSHICKLYLSQIYFCRLNPNLEFIFSSIYFNRSFNKLAILNLNL